eukprot:273460_1
MAALCIFVTISISISVSNGKVDNNTLICNSDCTIDCKADQVSYCNNGTVYCADGVQCTISSYTNWYDSNPGMTGFTFYCGNMSVCHIYCGADCIDITIHGNYSKELILGITDYPNARPSSTRKNIRMYGTFAKQLNFAVSLQDNNEYVNNVLLYAPNATNVSVNLYYDGYFTNINNLIMYIDYIKYLYFRSQSYTYTGNNGTIIYAQYVDNIYFQCIGCGYSNIYAMDVKTIYHVCGGCSNMSVNILNANNAHFIAGNYSLINAFNANYVLLESIDAIRYINGTNATYMDFSCGSYNYYTRCWNVELFCSSYNCVISGGYINSTIYCPKNSLCSINSAYMSRSIIYANYSKELTMFCGDCYYNKIFAKNVSFLTYSTVRKVHYASLNDMIYAPYATNILFLLQSTWNTYINADYANNLSIKCIMGNPVDDYQRSCYNMTINAKHSTNFSLLCNGSLSCYFLKINAMYSNNFNMNAYIRAAYSGVIFNAKYSNVININCIGENKTFSSYHNYGTCMWSTFYFEYSHYANFNCLGIQSCTDNISILAQHSQTINFYATARYNFAVRHITLDGRNASNMNVIMENNDDNNVAKNMLIYTSSNKTTSIYCNGINSCGLMNIYSIKGIHDVNITFYPNCTNCGNITYNNSGFEFMDFNCFQSMEMYLLCGKNYQHKTQFGSDNIDNNELCDDECCNNSKFIKQCNKHNKLNKLINSISFSHIIAHRTISNTLIH